MGENLGFGEANRRGALEARGEFGPVAPGWKAEFDLDHRRSAVGPDGSHSFGLRKRHPEAWFDIILDHTAGFADAIVCHGSQSSQVVGERHGPRTADCSGIDPGPRGGGAPGRAAVAVAYS